MSFAFPTADPDVIPAFTRGYVSEIAPLQRNVWRELLRAVSFINIKKLGMMAPLAFNYARQNRFSLYHIGCV